MRLRFHTATIITQKLFSQILIANLFRLILAGAFALSYGSLAAVLQAGFAGGINHMDQLFGRKYNDECALDIVQHLVTFRTSVTPTSESRRVFTIALLYKRIYPERYISRINTFETVE